jgi:uncharacterized repeat protein (TIGR03803 family)
MKQLLSSRLLKNGSVVSGLSWLWMSLLVAFGVVAVPAGTCAQDVFWGLTSEGGPTGAGTIFSIKSTGTDFTVHEGDARPGSLVQGSNGYFYGFSRGGAGGRVFRLAPDGTDFTVLHTFDGNDGGAGPTGRLVEGPDGYFYGMTTAGGYNYRGTIFKISPDGDDFLVMKGFHYLDKGFYPEGSLTLGRDGNLYGMTLYTIFKIAPDGSGFAVIHEFVPYTDGYMAKGSLVQAQDGRLYGMTTEFGDYDVGTIFSIAPDGSGFKVLQSFNSETDGGNPQGDLIEGSDGRLYGMTRNTIFSIETNGSDFIILHSFNYDSDGGGPIGSLVEGTDGRLYGLTSDGGAKGGGTIFSIQADGSDYTVLRTFDPSSDGANPQGNLIIQQTLSAQQPDKTIGGNRDDHLSVSIPTRDGGYLLAGSSASAVSGEKSQPSRGGVDYWIVKLTAGGATQWDKTFGGSGADHLTAAVQTADGGYLLGGYSRSGASGEKSQDTRGGTDYWIIKIDRQGAKEWDKRFGGADEDKLYALLQTADGGYLLGGLSRSEAGGDKTHDSFTEDQEGRNWDDFWVIKISGTGEKQWDNTVGGYQPEGFASMIATADGGYLLAGTTTFFSIGYQYDQENYWLVKLNSEGRQQWTRIYGDSGADILHSVTATADGGYLLAGSSNSGAGPDKSEPKIGPDDYLVPDYWVIKVDQAGTKQWDKVYGTAEWDELRSVIQTRDGGYLLGGYTRGGAGYDKSEDNRGGNDYWIVKINSSGSKLWDKRYGGTGEDQLYSLLQTSEGSYLLTGSSNSPVSGDKREASRGGYDYWIVKTTPDRIVTPRVASFTLVNADTDEDILTLPDGESVYLSDLPTLNLNIRANTYPRNVGSVVFHLNGQQRAVENHPPYAIGGDHYPQNPNDYKAFQLPLGNITLMATPYSAPGGQGTAGTPLTVNFGVDGFSVRGFTLINVDTDEPIRELREGDMIDYGQIGTRNINIRANTFPQKVGSVEFLLNGQRRAVENLPPYAIGGDHYPDTTNYKAFPLAAGEYQLEAIPYSAQQRRGMAGWSRQISFMVLEGNRTARMGGETGGSLSVFPNPFSDHITLSLGGYGPGPIHLRLSDALGRSYYQATHRLGSGQTEVTISTTNLQPGLYLLRVQGQSTPAQVLKLLKQ